MGQTGANTAAGCPRASQRDAGVTFRAIETIRQISQEHREGGHDLQVIGVYPQPTLAQGEQIIAAPTLVKKLPLPLRRFIGDLSNVDRILVGLDLRQRERRKGTEEG